jgi:hypothetical protein
MKLTIYVIVLVLLFLWLSGIAIHFKPFKISFGNLLGAIGWGYIIIGVLALSIQGSRLGYKNGWNDCKNEVEKIIDNKVEEIKSNPDWCQHSDTCVNKVCISHPKDCEEDKR